MTTSKIAIIGGGLSGLYAAYLLERENIHDYVLFEASNTLGGRLSSPSGIDENAELFREFDLGGTWYWPSFQPLLARVIQELGLCSFSQYESGDMIFDKSESIAPQHVPGFINEPPMLRLKGGMHALIDAIQSRVNADRIKTSHKVVQLNAVSDGIELQMQNTQGQSILHNCQYVLMAIPPRLTASVLGFNPSLPDGLVISWKQTSTWMASHAKYLAIYEQPFWRANGLSGEARSVWGPMAEIHDASAEHGQGALFGFMRIPAINRQWIPEKDLITSCRAQLVRLFGAEAAFPKAEFLKDWAKSEFTTTPLDLTSSQSHDAAPKATVDSGVWKNRLIGIGSEWSPLYPGYVAGAIDASTRGATKLRNILIADQAPEIIIKENA
jgi:monoamine oxidase